MPPVKDHPKRPQHVIDEAVKRHMAGEPAAVLSKYYKVSKAGFYLWVKKYKMQLLEQSRRGNLTPKEAELSDKRTLIAENEALRMEVRKLRDKVVTMMIKAGEL